LQRVADLPKIDQAGERFSVDQVIVADGQFFDLVAAVNCTGPGSVQVHPENVAASHRQWIGSRDNLSAEDSANATRIERKR
jgi:hypothetical protein